MKSNQMNSTSTKSHSDQSDEILCEECGHFYNDQSGSGLCGYCAVEEHKRNGFDWVLEDIASENIDGAK